MPFTVFQNKQGWKIRKPSENKIYLQVFKTKKSAISMASNWMRYRHEKPNIKVEGGRYPEPNAAWFRKYYPGGKILPPRLKTTPYHWKRAPLPGTNLARHYNLDKYGVPR